MIRRGDWLRLREYDADLNLARESEIQDQKLAGPIVQEDDSEEFLVSTSRSLTALEQQGEEEGSDRLVVSRIQADLEIGSNGWIYVNGHFGGSNGGSLRTEAGELTTIPSRNASITPGIGKRFPAWEIFLMGLR